MTSDLQKMYQYQQISRKKGEESVCHTAILKCEYGTKTCILNLRNSHGKYVGSNPQINVKDGKGASFGYCSVMKTKCEAELSDWYNGNDSDLMFDEESLSMQKSVSKDNSFMVCDKGGIITAETSGQMIQKPMIYRSENRVYITEDKLYIVVDGIKFEIYYPETRVTIQPIEDWYDVDTWTANELDCKAALADLADFINIFDIEEPQREDFYDTSGVRLQKKYPESSKSWDKHLKGVGQILGIQFVVNIVEYLSQLIENTYIRFIFQVSSLKRHRVVIQGGTKNTTIRFQWYEYYDRYVSYIFNVVPTAFKYQTIDGIQKKGYNAIKPLVDKIRNAKSQAKLLVKEEQLCLSQDEYYDVVCKLDHARKMNPYQMYIYTDKKGKICQRLILYHGEELRIVKRKRQTLYFLEDVIPLMELIDDTIIENIDRDESNEYWKLVEKILQSHYDKYESEYMKNKCQKVFDKYNL